MDLISAVRQALPLLVLVSQILALYVAIIFIFFRKGKFGKKVLGVFAKNALLFSFIVSLTATSGSLFYSEIAHFTPCILCWYQRILMYPMVFLFGMGLWRDDEKILDYGALLSVVGAVIAGYHYLVQTGRLPSPSCSTVGFSVSCAERFTMSYGYITIPMMSLTAFVLILGIWVLKKKGKGTGTPTS